MKKLTLLALSCALLLSGCSIFGKLSAIEYNNKVVDTINQSSSALEQSATIYNNTVPDIVSEKDEVDPAAMQTIYKDAEYALERIENLLSLESRNIEQQNSVRTGLTTYQSAGQAYLETYETMLTYYGQGEYQKDISKVKTIDENLHTTYTTFIQANNDLVDALESFVSSGD